MIIVDIETTGLDPYADKIIEIGALKIEGENITAEFSELINPGIPLPEIIKEITGIQDDMLKDKPPIEEVLPRFVEFCGERTLVGHNIIDFDYKFLYNAAKRANIKFDYSLIDTLVIARRKLPKHIKKGLAQLCVYYDIHNDSAHRALGDARATFEIYKRLK